MAKSANSRHCASQGLPCPPEVRRQIGASCENGTQVSGWRYEPVTLREGVDTQLTSRMRPCSCGFRPSNSRHAGNAVAPMLHHAQQRRAPLQRSAEVVAHHVGSMQKSNGRTPRTHMRDAQKTVCVCAMVSGGIKVSINRTKYYSSVNSKVSI
jgi:hypothetical protein